MTTNTTLSTSNENWVTRVMEPAPNASQVRGLFERAYTSSQVADNFTARHFAPAGYGSLAFIVAFFDTLTFAGKMLSDTLIEVLQLRFDEASAALGSNAFDAYYSAKQLVLLPFCIFASLFFPDEVFGRMHYATATVAASSTTSPAAAAPTQLSDVPPTLLEEHARQVRTQVEEELRANNPLTQRVSQLESQIASLTEENRRLMSSGNVSEDVQVEFLRLREENQNYSNGTVVADAISQRLLELDGQLNAANRRLAAADEQRQRREVTQEQDIEMAVTQAQDQLTEREITPLRQRVAELEPLASERNVAVAERNSLRTWGPRVYAVIEWARTARISAHQLSNLINEASDMTQETWTGPLFKGNRIFQGCPFEQIETYYPVPS